MSQELLTQICEKMPDELTPFVIHYLTTQYGKDAPSSCSLVWGKRKVQPTYEGLHAYLEELGFQSRMEAVVVRSIVEQPEDIVDFAISSFADCAASLELEQPEPQPEPASPRESEAATAAAAEAVAAAEVGEMETASKPDESGDNATDQASELQPEDSHEGEAAPPAEN